MTNQNCSISSKIYWPIRFVGALPLFSKLVSSCFTIMTHLLWVIFSLTYSPGHTFWIKNFILFCTKSYRRIGMGWSTNANHQKYWHHLQLPNNRGKLKISGALYTLRIQYQNTQTECENCARDVRVLKLTPVRIQTAYTLPSMI